MCNNGELGGLGALRALCLPSHGRISKKKKRRVINMKEEEHERGARKGKPDGRWGTGGDSARTVKKMNRPKCKGGLSRAESRELVFSIH